MYLTVVDYVIAVTMLVMPLGIGLFYAWADSKRLNREEYLLGGRKMKMLPVALSYFMTFQSAIALMGVPSDVYRFGPMIGAIYIGNALGCLLGYFAMIPVMYPLRVTSVYEYLEMRYKSRSVRMFSTVVGMLQMFSYMVIALLAPGLALQAAAGIPFWMSVAVVGGIGTFYTAIGGIKSVIWTDAFQALVYFCGVLLLIVRGIIAVGGAEKVWSISEAGGRTSMTTFSPDPRTRHSWWGMVIGGSAVWLTNVYSQSCVQRVSSMKSIQSAKKSFLINIPCHLTGGVILVTIGIITYSYFYDLRCDPLESGEISNMNQMTLYFMLHVLQDTPGLAGFYMATIFSGALSTLSSGINSLAANTVEDILPGILRGFSERAMTILAKITAFIYGLLILGVTYLARSLEGSITQMAISIFGASGSVSLAMFLVGSSVPWANKYGALAGGILSLAMNLWLVIGNRLYGRKIRPLPSPATDQCDSLFNSSYVQYNTMAKLSESTIITHMTNTTASANVDGPYAYGFFLYDISYEWYGLIGALMCSVSILIISKFTGGQRQPKTDARLILPVLRRFWHLHSIPTADEHEIESLGVNGNV